ncbi:MAG: CBS domain-containing protein [Candidatus Omnitrophica bacterium]|nr:CBS domain-containing protein [Candidatus Omnitrophota bacterium]
MFKVKDVMTKNVVAVGKDTNVYDALNILVDQRISGLPVVDRSHRVVGILTEKDLLGLIMNERAVKFKKVADYMTKKVQSFNEDDSLISLCKFFMDNAVRRVPVLDEHGVLKGIAARRDVLSVIAEMRGEKKRKDHPEPAKA